MLRRLSFVAMLAAILATEVRAQDPVYSQFFASPLQLNPAFAGHALAPFIALNHRRQWPGLGPAYITTSASYDQFSRKTNSGIGISILTDDAGQGILKRNDVSATYAYRVQMTKNYYAKMGIEVGMIQHRLDWQKLVFYDMIDPETGLTTMNGVPIASGEVAPDRLTTTVLDLSSGLLFYSQKSYLGISAKHLNTPNTYFLRINDRLNNGLFTRWTVHSGYQITLKEANRRRPESYLSPNVMFVKQGPAWQLNAGLYASTFVLSAGAWYRVSSNADAMIFYLGVKPGIFKVGYSFDFTVSSLGQNVTDGTHEFSLVFNFEEARNKSKEKYQDCFKMFH
jgi:type IX secretion system PorP/SprF family membrane protein